MVQEPREHAGFLRLRHSSGKGTNNAAPSSRPAKHLALPHTAIEGDKPGTCLVLTQALEKKMESNASHKRGRHSCGGPH